MRVSDLLDETIILPNYIFIMSEQLENLAVDFFKKFARGVEVGKEQKATRRVQYFFALMQHKFFKTFQPILRVPSAVL